MIARTKMLQDWLSQQPALSGYSIEPASGDASFRRYFRIKDAEQSYIAMDAPPEKEDSRPFLDIAQRFSEIGLHVPKIFSSDLIRGFVLLEDLGTRHYLDALCSDNVGRLYGDALGALMIIQACGPTHGLPGYDRALLMQEMQLFRDWLFAKQLRLVLSDAERQVLDAAFEFLAVSALEQTRVCVHRDFHSRNLMVCHSPTPGILDFQDAVIGPVTYDLVSLLRDCYIAWPATQVEEWAMGYYELAVQSGVLNEVHESKFMRWFDLMGIQRHLKASGIFARLHQRDGKPGYLGDIPRTLNYILEVSQNYGELDGLRRLIEARVMPVARDLMRSPG